MHVFSTYNKEVIVLPDSSVLFTVIVVVIEIGLSVLFAWQVTTTVFVNDSSVIVETFLPFETTECTLVSFKLQLK